NTMPSNKFAVDFFDYQSNNVENENFQDPELAGHLAHPANRDNHYDAIEPDSQDWELQRESIFHRHIIQECAMQSELNANTSSDNPLTIGPYDPDSAG